MKSRRNLLSVFLETPAADGLARRLRSIIERAPAASLAANHASVFDSRVLRFEHGPSVGLPIRIQHTVETGLPILIQGQH